MKRTLLLAAAGGGLLAAGVALGRLTRTPALDATLYAQNRIPVVQQHLDEAEPGYVLLAGDSNAELQSPSERICGAPVVDAGVSGATAKVYRRLFARLRFPVRPRAAVLTIGTNTLNAKNAPRSADTAEAFEKDVAALVGTLRSLTDTVVVTAVPPLGRELEGRFDGPAVEDYSRRIAALCDRIGCRTVDPFANLRDGTSGFGVPGANLNGLHLARYKPTLREIGKAICSSEGTGAGSSTPSPAPAP